MQGPSARDSASGVQTVPTATLTDPSGRGPAWDCHVALLVYHRDGVEMLHLRSGVPVTIGRAPPAQVQIRESCLSRVHARFMLLEGKILVEDPGSTNGTWINGERIDHGEVRPGDEVVLGGVVRAMLALTPADGDLPGCLRYDRFRGVLEEELVRARYLHSALAVLVVRSPCAARGHVSRWYLQLQALLRPIDRMALYSSDTVGILLPEASLETASELATKITELRPAGELPLLVGVAPFPGAAARAEELFELCLKAAQRATPKHPVEGVPLGTWTPAGPPRRAEAPGAPICENAAMRAIFDRVERLSLASIPVLLQGETGTGKEVVARAIHERGSRRAGPMVCVNCGAIPLQLVESTLFGHERGAFTGASEQQHGVFEAANGGTVLLDEIGELPAAAQAALLRVLESRRVVRVGSSKEVEVDVRLVAATHRDLEAMCRAGTFRSDLLYRLNAMTLTIPPLRERLEDILPLAARFLEQANRSNGRSIRGIGPDARDRLLGYSWPGNVRELRNAMERAVVIAEGHTITVEDLPERVREGVPLGLTTTEPPGEGEGERAGEGDQGLRARVLRYEIDQIVSALKDSGGNQTEAAHRLGLPLRTLVYRLRALGITRLGYGTPGHGELVTPPPAPAKGQRGRRRV